MRDSKSKVSCVLHLAIIQVH